MRRLSSILIPLLLAGASGQNMQPAKEAIAAASKGTHVVILGSGNPRATPDASGPAVAVVVNGSAYVVDCGPGVVRRAAMAAERNGLDALKAQNLRLVFITHLHSDHTLGYPDLIFSPWVLGRKVPLEAYGPKGLTAMTEHLEKAWEKDVEIRTNGMEHGNRTGYQVQTHEVKPGTIYKDENVTVKAFAVAHGTWDEAFAYRFETADRNIVISGDTGPTDSIIKACDGCDVLVHEAYPSAAYSSATADWQKYMKAFHTSTEELAREAAQAKPRLLVLYHYSGTDHATRVAEIRRFYPGPVVSAHDLDIF